MARRRRPVIPKSPVPVEIEQRSSEKVPCLSDVECPKGGHVFNPPPGCKWRKRDSAGYFWTDRGCCILYCTGDIECANYKDRPKK